MFIRSLCSICCGSRGGGAGGGGVFGLGADLPMYQDRERIELARFYGL